MLAILGFSQIKLGAAANHLFAMLNEIFKERFERERLRHAINERHHVEMKRLFKLFSRTKSATDIMRSALLTRYGSEEMMIWNALLFVSTISASPRTTMP